MADITEDKKEKTLLLMIMNSSPGVLDEDRYQIKIELSEGCSLQLHTQSYQRLFAMKKSASQALEVRQASDSSFYFYHILWCLMKHLIFSQTTKYFSLKTAV